MDGFFGTAGVFFAVVTFFVVVGFFTGAFFAVDVGFLGVTAGLVEVRLVLAAAGFVLAAGRAAGVFLEATGLVGATFAFVATVLEAVGFFDTGLAFCIPRDIIYLK